MSVWDLYGNRVASGGGSKHASSLDRERRAIETRLPDNLSIETGVTIYKSEYGFNIDSESAQENKIIQDVAIIDSDNLNEKNIYSMPGEDIELGSLIFMQGFYWLVTEKSHRNVVYTRAKIMQCNHILKWIYNGEIMTQWCIIEDGTKLTCTRRYTIVWRIGNGA